MSREQITIKGQLDPAYRLILGLFALLTVTAFLLDTPREITEGLWRIFSSRSILISDYAEIGGPGAMLINAVLVGLWSLGMLIRGGIKPTGAIIMGLWLVLGFAFFGKNVVNTIPLSIGVWLYVKLVRCPFKEVCLGTMLCATISPIVSEIAHILPLPILPSLLIAGVVGVGIGIIFPPLASSMGRVHGGYLLYSAGLAGGLVASLTAGILRGGGLEILPERYWSEAYTLPLAILMYVIAIAFALWGIFRGGADKWVQWKAMHKRDGMLPSDYLVDHGNITYLNIGVLLALSTTATLLVGAPINGPMMGGIFCVAGFGALGKHVKNVVPIMLGALLGGLVHRNGIAHPSILLALLFSTGLAPVAGVFGPVIGIIAGFLHIAIVSIIGELNSGLNLYNNGFAGGLLVITLVPVFAAFLKKRKERKEQKNQERAC